MPPAPDHATLDRVAAEFDTELIALRHELHRRPELAGGERRTAAQVAERLRAEGLSVTTGVGGHGVVAVVEGAGDGPVIAYRADMDAVATEHGPAHLCGHDMHTAVGVGIARVLARLRDRFSGRVVLVFQPAEETLEGARAMLDDGALEPLAPHEIYALHCGPLPVGQFAVMPGVGLPGLDMGHIDVTGADAQRLAAEIEGLSTVEYPRSPEEFARLAGELQTPDGPMARFVVAGAGASPDRVWFWLRAWPDDRYPELREEIRRLAGDARVEFAGPPFPAMVCSPELSLSAAGYMREVPWVTDVGVLHASFPFNGEDFALFLHRVPGAMFYLGVADPQTGINGVPHAPDFAADDRAIGIGVRTMAGLVLDRLSARGQVRPPR